MSKPNKSTQQELPEELIGLEECEARWSNSLERIEAYLL